MKNKSKIVLVAAVTGFVAFLFAVFTIISVFIIISNSEEHTEEANISEELNENAVTENVYSDKNEIYDTTTYSSVPEFTSAMNNENIYGDDIFTENEPEYTETVLTDNSFYIVSDTPSGAGVVMRSKASSTSDNLGVLPEGSRVYVFSDHSSNKTGYVRVRTADTQADMHGYVLKRYLRFESVFVQNVPLAGSQTKYISFATPSHDGINLRAEPNSKSEKLCLLSEGERVTVLENYDPQNNGYIKVAYDHPHAGEVYEGWVLAQYLVD